MGKNKSDKEDSDSEEEVTNKELKKLLLGLTRKVETYEKKQKETEKKGKKK